MTFLSKIFSWSLCLAALALANGCATATRMSIPPEELHYQFTVRHAQSVAQAFSHVELALAEA